MKFIICFTTVVYFVLSVSLSQAAETVKIAGLWAKTGQAAASSNLLWFQTARFAVEELNQKGGLLGRRIKLVEIDNLSTALGSKVAAKKAVKAGVVAVIGPGWSSHAIAAAPILQKAEIPMISPTATNPKVTLIGNYIFRTCFIDPFQGTVMAKFAINDLKAKTAIIFINTSRAYSIGLAEFFIRSFEKQGGQIISKHNYLDESVNPAPLIESVKKQRPDVFFVPGDDRDTGVIINQARKLGISSTFLGGDAWSNQMYKYGGEKIHGNFYSTHWDRVVNREKSQNFVKRYEKKHGTIDAAGVFLTYDAFLLLEDAVRRADSLDPKQIRDALASTENFQGTSGEYNFDQNGDPIKAAVILKYEKETSVYIKLVKP